MTENNNTENITPAAPGKEETALMEEYSTDLARLERQVKNLSKLVDINTIINSTLDISRLLSLIMEIIKDIMETEASTMLLYEEETDDLVFKVALGGAGDELTEKYRVAMGQGIAGWVARNRRPLVVNDVYQDERFDPNFDKSTGFTTRAILCAPLLYKGKLLGVIQAINPINQPQFFEEDMNLFRVFGDQAALAVQNAIFFKNALEEERIKSELDSAGSIKNALVPNFSLELKNIMITAHSRPAREVGGGFHGYYRLNDHQSGIALGDIHQKGIPGGLHASSISGALRAMSSLVGTRPAALMRQMKNAAIKDVEFLKRMSLFYGVIDTDTDTLTFVNAGVAYPILMRNGKSSYLRLGTSSVGDTETGQRRVTVPLRKDDVFVVVADGILNIRNHNGQVLGLKRVMEFLEKDFTSSEEIATGLLEFSRDFAGGLEIREDISLITMLKK